MQSATPASGQPIISRQEKEAELRHLLGCGLVREGTQLHALLGYLGAKALDPPEFLKEFTIGVEALAKPADHDPRVDPTVRVEISKLRKRLREYYHEAGAARPVHMEIPHGAYLPVFASAVPIGAPQGRHFLLGWPWTAVAAVAVLSVIVVYLLFRQPAPALPPTLNALWAPHLDKRVPTLLVCGTPMFVKVKGSYFRDTNLNRAEDMAVSKKLQKVIEALQPDELRPVTTFVGMGEAHGVFEITRLLSTYGTQIILRQSHEVSWEDLKHKHVIFLGGKKYNPQIPLLPFKPAFESVNRRIINVSPEKAEPAEYLTSSVTPYGELTREFVLISVYPGLTPETRLMALDSSSTEGTLAAAEFITREDKVSQLMAKGVPIEKENGKFRAFQVVISAKYNKGVAVDLSYVTHRVMGPTN